MASFKNIDDWFKTYDRAVDRAVENQTLGPPRKPIRAMLRSAASTPSLFGSMPSRWSHSHSTSASRGQDEWEAAIDLEDVSNLPSTSSSSSSTTTTTSSSSTSHVSSSSSSNTNPPPTPPMPVRRPIKAQSYAFFPRHHLSASPALSSPTGEDEPSGSSGAPSEKTPLLMEHASGSSSPHDAQLGLSSSAAGSFSKRVRFVDGLPSAPSNPDVAQSLESESGQESEDGLETDSDDRSSLLFSYEPTAFKPTAFLSDLRINTDVDSDSHGEVIEVDSSTPFKKMMAEGWKRMPYYIPIIGWLPSYRWRAHFLADLFAGIAVSLMLIPQCLAYALIAGVPPIVGLYSGLMPLVVYGVMGSSPHIAAGPEGLLSLLVGSTLSRFVLTNDISSQPEVLAEYASILALYVGFFTFILGLLRVGFFDNLFSRPILSGFVTAAALIIMIEQLPTFWGYHSTNEHTIGKLEAFFDHFLSPNVLGLCIGIGCLFLMISIEVLKATLAERWEHVRLIPTTLIIVCVGVGLGAGIGVDQFGVAILGDISGGFPIPWFPPIWNFIAFRSLFGPAILISIVGYVESMSGAKLYGAKYSYIISPNRELVAYGAGNIVGGIFRAYPVFASLTRCSLNDIAGAKTQLAGLVTAGLNLITILFLMPLFHWLPKSTAAAIVMFAAAKLIHFDVIMFLWRIKAWIDIALAGVTLLLTFFLGPEIGILVAMGMSLFIIVKATTMPHLAILGEVPSFEDDPNPDNRFCDIASHPDAQLIPGFLIFRVTDQLCFANIGTLQMMLQRAEKIGKFRAHPTDPTILESPIHAIIMDSGSVTEVDAQSLQILLEVLIDYKRRGVSFAFVNLDVKFRQALVNAEINEYHSTEAIGPHSFFPTIHHALESLGGHFIECSTYTI